MKRTSQQLFLVLENNNDVQLMKVEDIKCKILYIIVREIIKNENEIRKNLNYEWILIKQTDTYLSFICIIYQLINCLENSILNRNLR